MASISDSICTNCNKPDGAGLDGSLPCANCGAISCRVCGKRTVRNGKFCMHCSHPTGCVRCGAEFPPGAQYCPACGISTGELRSDARELREKATGHRLGRLTIQPATSDRWPNPGIPAVASAVAASDYIYFQVRARQGGMAVGRSILANVLGGQPSLIKCHFEIFDEGGVVDEPYLRIEFLIYAGRSYSLEQLSGTDRSEAESALRAIDKTMSKEGFQRIADGPQWYSHRYRISSKEFLADRGLTPD
jgi:ribosomal protein L40E